jgi:DNA-binding IclR family transcriptional regulator
MTAEIMDRWARRKGQEHNLEAHSRFILTELAQHFPGIGQDHPLPSAGELSEATGLPVPEVRRHVKALIAAGILEQTGLGVYRLSP